MSTKLSPSGSVGTRQYGLEEVISSECGRRHYADMHMENLQSSLRKTQGMMARLMEQLVKTKVFDNTDIECILDFQWQIVEEE